ncbi:MAG: amidohydrolase family protein [Clostridia bacterium]
MMYSCAPAGSGSGAVVKKKGRNLRVDIHCHYSNPEAAAKAAPHNPAQHEMQIKFANAFTRETNQKQMKERGARLSDIALRLKEMDKAGIDIQAVSPAPPQMYHWAEPGLGQELARMVNTRLAEIVAAHPDRFVALGSVPLQDAGLAVQELEYVVKKLDFRGVEIGGNVNGRNLTDPALGLEKFFAKAEELGIVVFIHPGGFTQAERLTEHYFNNVIGNPLETTVAASYLIFDGVMDRHPKLKVVLPHGGGYLAHYWARMDHAWKARPDCRLKIGKRPSSYLEKFYFDTITFDHAMLRQQIDRFGAGHTLLGTDYPFDMGVENPVAFIAKTPRLTANERRLIEGANAAKLLKIDYNKATSRRRT